MNLYELTDFVKHETKGKKCYTENVKSMLENLIDSIFVEFARHIVQQINGIPMGTN